MPTSRSQGNEKEELKKIVARSPDAGLEYATDEDLYMSNDPRVNVYDLGSDTLEYAKQRIELSNEVIKEMEKNLVKGRRFVGGCDRRS